MVANRRPKPHSLLTIPEVLTELRISRSTLDTWRALGTAPTIIKLPQLRVPAADLDAWLCAHVITANKGFFTLPPRPLLIVGEVLAELRISRSTLDTWRTLGTSPTIIKLPNGQLRVPHLDFQAWLSGRIEITEAA